MKRGRRICNQLKAVRRQIAEENGIDLQQPECHHTGDCRGTCPRCEAEVRYLEQALTQRLLLGKAATVAGLTLSLAACGGTDKSSLQTEKPLDSPKTTASEVPTVPDTSGTNPLSDDSLVVTGLEGEPSYIVPVPGDIDIIDLDDSKNHTDSSALKPPEEELVEGEVTAAVSVAEEEASFPGGTEALYRYLAQNIQRPKDDVTGTVIVRFIVELDGSITNVRLLRDIGGGCGKEAVRVVKTMPPWIPAKNQGKVVRSEFTLPIRF